MQGIVRTPRRPDGWTPPGPPPRGARGRAELAPGEDEDLCLLSGDWRIFQQQRGHRWSLDDLVTACLAARAVQAPPERALDMGCGIGSVLMMIAWRFPTARVDGIEAQALSARMARRSLAWNGADDRCTVHDGDLRDPRVLDAEPRSFPLVTGTPPYFPIGDGVESDKPQCAPCRFEHRGGVEAYCEAASRWLAPGGRFVMCAAAGEVGRVREGAREAGLDLLAWTEVVPREGKAPLVAVFTLAHAGEGAQRNDEAERLVVRDARSAWTPAFVEVRREMGLPPSPPSRGAGR